MGHPGLPWKRAERKDTEVAGKAQGTVKVTWRHACGPGRSLPHYRHGVIRTRELTIGAEP